MEHLLDGRLTQEPLGEQRRECEKHGEYLSSGVRYFGRREIWTQCPDCTAEEESARLKAEAERKATEAQQRMESLLEQACIPQRFIGRTFDRFNAETPAQQSALQIVRGYSDSFSQHLRKGTGLILSGLPGTGKSHLAGAVLQAILPEHCGLYVTCLGLIRMVRSTWRKDNETSEAEVMRTLSNVPLLVIDEIGVQYGTEGEQTILFELLDERYRNLRPTILLTNQDKNGLKQFLGERTYDRLTETCRWVPFDWESYRPTARREAA
jgi:DNA replication protein DnaC